jgi:hypothetical protein
MGYTFTDHIHNFAVWTAARAVQRNFTNTGNIKSAIEKAELRLLIDSREIWTNEQFDIYHQGKANIIITSLKVGGKALEIKATYGRAAKIIAIYIKTVAVIRYSGVGNLAKIAHPPIDRILLTKAHKDHQNLGLDKINWTQLSEIEYFDLIGKLRTLRFENFWEIEKYWSPLQNE